MPYQPNQFILLEHRHEQKRAGAGKLGDGFVWVFRGNVGNMDDLFCADDSIKAGGISAPDRWRCFIKCRKFLRRVVERNATERLPVTKQHRAERGLTNAGCICQHSLENPIELAGRRANDAQHLVARRLPF
jgi:hypothetical protein